MDAERFSDLHLTLSTIIKPMLIGQVFEKAKIDPTETEIFLSYLLGKDRSFVKAFPEFKLGKRQITKLKEFLKRRARHEPLAYILGYQEFCGLIFKVDSRVMIPRAETEDLVAEVIKHVYAQPNRSLRALRSEELRSLRNSPAERGQYSRALRPLRGLRNSADHWQADQLKIVDVGTGCGNIAICLALAAPFAKIFAVEKDPKAHRAARENIADHGVSKQVELLLGDLLEPINEPIDIITANLPYIPSARFAALAPEIRDWEPVVALDGGDDGLKLYRCLFAQAGRVLKPSGLLFYELDGKTYLQRR